MLTALTLGPALAPVVAFPVISSMGWRWVFYLTAVPGVLTVALALLLLRDAPDRKNVTGGPTPAPSTERAAEVSPPGVPGGRRTSG